MRIEARVVAAESEIFLAVGRRKARNGVGVVSHIPSPGAEFEAGFGSQLSFNFEVRFGLVIFPEAGKQTSPENRLQAEFDFRLHVELHCKG